MFGRASTNEIWEAGLRVSAVPFRMAFDADTG
jgi:hypothetical protein